MVVHELGPVLVRNILKSMDENVYIVCQQLAGISDLFEYPLSSRLLNICKASGVCTETANVAVSDITSKCVCLPCQADGNTFAIIPFLHLGH